MLPVNDGFGWYSVTPFVAAYEILSEPDLRAVFTAAIENGYVIVEDGPSELDSIPPSD